MPFPMLIIAAILMAIASFSARAEPYSNYALAVGANADVGVMAYWMPKYEGAKKNAWSVGPLVSINSLTLPMIGRFGGNEGGLIISPSIRYVPGTSHLDGIGVKDTNDALELGVKAGWRFDYLRLWLAGRQGFGGHQGQRFDLGADLVMMPVSAGSNPLGWDKLTLEIGPRVHISSVDYSRTYFGGNTAGGFTGVGGEAKLIAVVTPSFTAQALFGYERLVGDVTRSEVVRNGSADQFTIGLGITYRIDAHYP